MRFPQTLNRLDSPAFVAAASTTGLSLLAAAVAFVANILIARALGPSARGEVAIVLQSAYVIGPLLSLGMNRVALRQSISGSGEHIWLISVPIIVVAVALGQIAAGACVAAAAISAQLSVERGIGMREGRLRPYILRQVGIQIWILAATTGLWFANVANPMWWYLVYAAPLPILLIIGRGLKFTVLTRAGVRKAFVDIDRQALRYMTGGFGVLLAARVERLALPVLASPRELGLYMSMATASELLVWGARGLGESRVARFVTDQPKRRTLVKLVLRDLLKFLLLAAPLAAAMNWLLLPLLGTAFEAAQVLIVPLCLSSAVWSAYLQTSSAWLATADARQSAALDGGAALLTGALVSALIPFFGALGAAYGCLAAYVILLVISVALVPTQRGHRPY